MPRLIDHSVVSLFFFSCYICATSLSSRCAVIALAFAASLSRRNRHESNIRGCSTSGGAFGVGGGGGGGGGGDEGGGWWGGGGGYEAGSGEGRKGQNGAGEWGLKIVG